jgi:FAD/FMN-containing dehydrogenase
LNLYNNVWKVPENTQKTNILISNDVTGLNKTEHSEVFIPKDENELSEILKNTKGKIAIAGSKKSMGGQSAIYAGVQISTENFNKILDYSTTTKEITVQSGVRWFEIQNHIDKDNLSVMIMQSYNNFSVGGSLSTNVHGRYIGYGPLIGSVKSFRIILYDGKIVEASREKNQELFFWDYFHFHFSIR